MRKISLIAASLLFASTLAAENDFHKAVTSGTVSGDVTLYGESTSKDANPDEGFTNGSFGLNYETASYNGLKASVGFRANHEFSEENSGDFGDDTNAILHTANISYATDAFGVTVGRQEIDLEWIGDFHEAVVVGITAIPDTTITLGYTNRAAVADADAGLNKFAKVNGSDGVYVLDAMYEGIEGLGLNAYYYKAENFAQWYGAKADYNADMFGVTAHGAKQANAKIMHLEGRTNISGFDLSAGYITTDKTRGAGVMDSYGDNLSPLEDGNQVYGADADTFYIGVGYEIEGVELAAMYGQTDFTSFKEKEFNLSAGYGINDNLSLGALYVDVNADESNGDNDYNKVALTVEYSF